MRSVMGHLAAHGASRYNKGPITEPLKDYILDDNKPLPQSVRLYYWLYPYQPQILIRDAALGRMGDLPPVVFWLMKFFPLAFFVTIGEPEQRQFQMRSLDQFGELSIDSERQVEVVLRPIVHQLWPETPNDHSFILYSGEQALLAKPLTKLVR